MIARRTLLLGGAAAAAAAAGAWFAATREIAPAPSSAVPWSLQFETPQGGVLAMQALRGRPLVLNFWAPWCAPCVKEMPEIDRFHAAFGPKGWQVVGLAIDRVEPVKAFLDRVPVSFPIGIAGLQGTELVRQLGNAQGGLPFTVLFDRAGRPARRKLGETDFDELASWAQEAA